MTAQPQIASLPKTLLWLLIVLYSAYFSWYTIQRHQTLNSYAADLSLIDQPMWNTLHGRFMSLTWGDQQQPRLAEHFEPILIPLAAVFWLWDDVRALLILQTIALALGALPLFWLARQAFQVALGRGPLRRAPAWVALAIAAVYLLSTHLQAANVADVHADTFIVTPFLFTFWYARQQRWGWMWFWALVALLVKENLPLLVFTFGVYLFLARPGQARPKVESSGSVSLGSDLKRAGTLLRRLAASAQRRQALALMVISLVWFLVATFLIVAPLARQYFGSDGPIYLANRYDGGPLEMLRRLAQPERLRYVEGLLASVGWLALLAPEILLIGLPLLLANVLSNFPGQYSGEQHYSVPLVPILVVAAIYGTVRLYSLVARATRTSARDVTFQARPVSLILIVLWLLAWSFSYHYRFGWTPLARRLEPFQANDHTRLLPRLLAQVPAGVAVSASPAVHPHLAHRPVVYAFPVVGQAEVVLVDVTDVPGTHPNDVRARIEELLASGWSLQDATDGFILLQKPPSPDQATRPGSQAGPSLPIDFFTFTWSDEPGPQYPLPVNFADAVRLLGYDVSDKPFLRQTRLRLYWQAIQPLPADLRLWPLVFDDYGQPLTDPLQQPPITTVWYPPERWQPGQVVVTELLPADYGQRFHLAVAIVSGETAAATHRAPIVSAPSSVIRFNDDTWAQLASFRRTQWALTVLESKATLGTLQTVQADFISGLQLTGVRIEGPTGPAPNVVNIALQWQAQAQLGEDFTLFVHLLDARGELVAQHDAQPAWIGLWPTSRWQVGIPALVGQRLILPDTLPPGEYELRAGMYRLLDGVVERIPLLSGADSVRLGTIRIK